MSTRRGHHEGSIHQRKQDGRWVGMIDLGIVDKKRRRRAYYGKTRREVAEKLKGALRSQQQGLPMAVDKQTTAAFLERWLTTAGVGPNTLRRYAQYVRFHAVPEIGAIPLVKLGPDDIQRLMDTCVASGKSPTTARHLRAVLRTALGQAEAWGLVQRNVARLAKPPRAVRHQMQTFTETQARTLLEASAGDRLDAIITLALTTGMRQGELLGLRWGDVDLDRKALHVRVALRWSGGVATLAEPKTPESRRQISLTATAVAALRRHRIAQAAERLRVGTAWQDGGLVFPNDIGRPIDPSNLVKRFHALVAQADLPRLRFHDLRHTAACLMLDRGIPVKVVSEMLGHAKTAITMDTYADRLPTMQLAATDILDAVFA